MFAARAKDAGELAISAGVSFCAGMPTRIVFAARRGTHKRQADGRNQDKGGTYGGASGLADSLSFFIAKLNRPA